MIFCANLGGYYNYRVITETNVFLSEDDDIISSKRRHFKRR